MDFNQYIAEVKENIVGVAILAFGVLAIVVVAALAYQRFGGDEEAAVVQRQAVSQEEIRDFKQVEKKQPKRAEKKKEPKKPRFKRQTSISERDITGAWDGFIDDGRVLLQMQEGVYKMVIIKDNRASPRRYSNGTYTLEKDILVLTPNLDWGPPKSQRYAYRVLTRGSMPVMVSKYKGKMVWQVPGEDADIYVPNYHPILSQVKDKIAVWGTLK